MEPVQNGNRFHRIRYSEMDNLDIPSALFTTVFKMLTVALIAVCVPLLFLLVLF